MSDKKEKTIAGLNILKQNFLEHQKFMISRFKQTR